LSGDLGSATDGEMTRQACLTRNHHVVLYNGASGQAHLRHDQAALANADVMCYLDQIVNLGAGPDHGIADATTIDGAIRTDLDIILYIAATHVTHM
jgi:hypothetical protein